MTQSRFKRLFLVLLGPLLFAGAIFAMLTHEKLDGLNIRCQPGLFMSENCRQTGWGEFDSSIAKQSPQWFEVEVRPFEQNSFPKVFVSASQRQIDDVEIVKVLQLNVREGDPETSQTQLQPLAGQKISIIFGIPDGHPRSLNPLACNRLNFEKAAVGIFIAELCAAPSGSASIEFRTGQKGRKDLMSMKAEIDNQTELGRKSLIHNYLLNTPVFVVLFLLLSAIIWIIRRMALYVLAG